LPELLIEEYREQFDFPVRDYYKRLGLPDKGSEFSEISSHFIEKYHVHWKECPLQKYAREVVSTIDSLGVYQSLLSAGKEEHVKSFVRHHNLHDYFFAIVGTTNIYAEGKIDRATSFMNTSALKDQRYLLVGDTLHDYEVAQALGIDCLLFSKGHHSEKKLAQTGSPIINELDQVLKWVS
jgi:phosphoglycolate phosphatase